MLDDTKEDFSSGNREIRQEWSMLHTMLCSHKTEDLLYNGRTLLSKMQTIICGCLLMIDAMHTRCERERVVAERWIQLQIRNNKYNLRHIARITTEDSQDDRLIFLGMQSMPVDPGAVGTKHKL